MLNEHVIIIGMALLINYLIFGRAWAAVLSVILIVGALRHPEVAPSGRQLEGTPEEQLQIIMLMVGLIVVVPVAVWWIRGLFRRG